MPDAPLQTLERLITQDYRAPAQKKRILFMHAREEKSTFLIRRWDQNNDLVCYQPFFEWHTFPENVRSVTLPEDIPDLSYDMIWICATKDKKETSGLVRKALDLLAEQGCVYISAANNQGGRSLEKLVMKHGGKVYETLVKNKCRAIKFCIDPAHQDLINKHIDFGLGAFQISPEGLWTCYGIYGAQKKDKGSELLIKYIKGKLKGHIADFGCGHGDLLYHSISGSKPESLWAIDHDARAINCASMNLSHIPALHVIWADCTKKIPELPALDLIVMNPPFHSAEKTDISLGQAFIINAAQYLKASGILYMVANQHLAYEKILPEHYRDFDILETKSGFKVIKAMK